MTTAELDKHFNDFAAKWIGGRIDFDRAAGYQCVDVTKAFYNYYWACPNLAVGTALKMWTNTPAKYLEFMDKVTDKSVIKKGDTVILFTSGHNGDYNYGAGHVGIANGQQDAANVTILEQNGSTGNGSGTKGDAIRYRSIAKTRIAGILRPKVSNPPVSSAMPAVGTRIQLIPTQTRTTYKPTTTQPAGTINVTGWNNIYWVRGYDSKYPYRVLIYTASGGGNVALALRYTNGKIIEGWRPYSQ